MPLKVEWTDAGLLRQRLEIRSFHAVPRRVEYGFGDSDSAFRPRGVSVFWAATQAGPEPGLFGVNRTTIEAHIRPLWPSARAGGAAEYPGRPDRENELAIQSSIPVLDPFPAHFIR
jgi:hypothetical protein